MYSLDQLKRGVRTPPLALREINRLYHTAARRTTGNPEGVDLIQEEWDNVLILDACRYDMFERIHALPGVLEKRQSKGSHTSEFLQANFAGRTLHDTVYVTASPMYYRNRGSLDAEFHDVIDIWREGGWHDEYRTVLPETVVEFAREANDAFPKKRLIVHFLQPHYPFVGPTGRKRFELNDLNFEWDKAVAGELDTPDRVLWEAFRENLEIVLPHVEDLIMELPGQSVVTADHGQMINERSSPIPMREYGHPPGIYTEELVTVPWLQYQNGGRKEIVAERPTDAGSEVDDTDVQDRLESLGYLE